MTERTFQIIMTRKLREWDTRRNQEKLQSLRLPMTYLLHLALPHGDTPQSPSYQEFIKALIYSLGPSLCDLDFFGNTPTDPALHISWIFVNPVSSWQLKLTYLGVSSGRGGLAVKSSCCCWRGPRFESPHQHSCLQPSITLGDPKSSSDFCRYQACTRWIYIHTGKILLHIK